jgi:putative hemolysin
MRMNFDKAGSSAVESTPVASHFGPPGRHVIDELIEERAAKLSRRLSWPLARPFLLRFLHYKQAVRMADAVAAMSGHEAMEHISGLLSLDIDLTGEGHIPRSGAFVLAPNHPTGIADGIAIFDVLKTRRPDMAIFANRDALRVAPRFRDVLIPVEWRQDEKTHAKSRDTLAETARAFASGRAVVLFPSGRIAFWHDGRLTERPWQNSAVQLARRYRVPIVPVHIAARNSGLFYLLSRWSDELRDITVFHELLNKRGSRVSITVGAPVPPAALEGDLAAVTRRLQDHAVETLARDPEARFSAR